MKNTKNIWFGIVLIALISCKKSEAVTSKTTTAKAPAGFRVIGYMPETDVESGAALSFDYSRVNYVNIAFINPDNNGNFAATPGLSAVITQAHQAKAKVMISIGGGSAPAYYATLLADSKRSDFINTLVNLTVADGFDGVDVDLEGPRIDANYESFVTALSAALKAKGKLLTAAIATAYQSQYTDAALSHFDFVNVMSYDKTGPWNPANPGQHSPYDMAVSDLDYWTNTRGIAKDKLSLGVPFYGYGFGQGAPGDISFKDLVTQYPGAENADQVTVSGGGIIYYNGIPTIKKKTQLALANAGGVMIWQLSQDAGGDKSLLSTIDASISSSGTK
jgi:chitinase